MSELIGILTAPPSAFRKSAPALETAIIIENDADHAEAKALVQEFVTPKDPAELARMTAQARLVETYERTRWPRRSPSVADLLVYLMEHPLFVTY